MGLVTIGRDARSVRPVTGLAALPSARAVIGGLLVAVAGLGAFVGWQRANQPTTSTYLVAAHPLAAGTTLSAEHLATVVADVPPGPADQLLSDPTAVIGQRLTHDLSAGALIDLGDLDATGTEPERHEVALRLAPEAALGGELDVADKVLVLTTDERCTSVLAAATVTSVVADQSLSGGSLIATVLVDDSAQVLSITHAARTAEVTLARSRDIGAASFCATP